MKNNSVIVKALIALATMVLAVSLWVLDLYFYENYLSKIWTAEVSLLNVLLMVALNIGLALLIVLIIYKLIRGIIKFVATYTFIEVMIGIVGVIVSLRIAWVMEFIFIKIPFVGNYLLVLLSIILGAVGWIETIKRKDEILAFIGKGKKPQGAMDKFVDTSVIIDGRISDIVKTGFIEGSLLIPDFVIDELQKLADSADDLKRAKGRQGLDSIKKMQNEGFNNVVIVPTEEKAVSDITDVDSKIVKLVSIKGGILLTNDFNLNKVAGVQGVKVLNINELANAMKPVLLPGEDFYLTILKKGKENNQGVGYLDDGTMIIVENGEALVGQSVQLVVTSIMQTSAGRLIFAKPKAQQGV